MLMTGILRADVLHRRRDGAREPGTAGNAEGSSRCFEEMIEVDGLSPA